MLSKNLLMKIKFINLISNSTILSLPGLISIIISLIAIPIHLNIAGPENYGNYLIFHFILMISLNLNFGIGKSVAISINNFPKYKKTISFKSILYTINISFILIVIILMAIILSILFFKDLKILNQFLIYILIGSIITIFFLTFEGIFQGWKKFGFLSIFNLLFNSVSFSLPSIMLVLFEDLQLNNLIFISIIIKFVVAISMFVIIILFGFIKNSQNEILYNNLSKNGKWITLNGLLNQLYDLFDKYLIKIFLGPIALASYSIPQQITGKLSIFSKSFSAYLLPNLSEKKGNYHDFNFSLNFFILLIPIIILFLIPIYPSILKLWLRQSYTDEILVLTKIFSLIAVYSCSSHILITKFEADKKLNNNLKIETSLMPFFLFCLYFIVKNGFSLSTISILILFKELILLFIRFYYFRNQIRKIKKYYLYSLIYLLILWFSFFNDYLFYASLITLTIITLKNDFK